ncbi:MAG: ATP-dependent RecD-like DNA helicase, partial [Youngiibacter sp.]|nr:ATP-dependent RecD-like DNA helicase [Youngiibacter sp.]
MDVLEGTVRDIVFQNEENAYCVLRIEDAKNLHTAVGIFPFVSPGQTLKLKGEWLNHATFGKQFKCTEYEEILPNSLLGIEKYLASGAISGIGPATAKKLVEKFGSKI